MSKKAPTLYDAVSNFLGPLVAEYARLIDEWPAETPVTIKMGGYEHETTLQVLKDLDRAHGAAFDAKIARDAKKSVGTLL
jgi:hypothetical protein